MALPVPRSQALLALVCFALVGCGGGEADTSRTLDESADFSGAGTSGGTGRPAHEVTMPTGLGATEWHFVEASCTEGPLDLSGRGFTSRLRIEEDGDALLLYNSHSYSTEGCDQTIVQRVTPPDGGELGIEEIARIAVPSTSTCFGQPEAPRPGEIIHSGARLEVLVQRSRWCGGFEVRFVYEQEMPRLPEEEEIVRLYAVHFSLGDADRIANMYAATGSLLEPFTRTSTGDPYRHDGREAVRAWYRDTFASAAWRALRIVSVERNGPHQMELHWEYMDPRLAVPVSGRNLFTMAAGEIFEGQIIVDGAPVLAPPITP